MYNLNHDLIFIEKFPFGKTQNIEIKMGRSLYLMDVSKSSDSAIVEFYKKLSKDRQSYSKHDKKAERHSVVVKNDAVLDREFFEHISEIEKAQEVYQKYSRKIK